MTNEQTALLLRGYQFRLRTIIRRTPMIDARKEMEEFDTDLTKHIRELLRLDKGERHAD